jgi:hypothetical protein
MPASTLTKFNDFVEQLGKGVHDFSSHTFKCALTNSAPSASNTILSDIIEISATGGYSAGGYTLSGVVWSEASGVAKLVISDLVITASGGNVGPFQYLVIYNDSATSPLNALVGYLSYGAALTLADTEALTSDFDGTNGVLTVT